MRKMEEHDARIVELREELREAHGKWKDEKEKVPHAPRNSGGLRFTTDDAPSHGSSMPGVMVDVPLSSRPISKGGKS